MSVQQLLNECLTIWRCIKHDRHSLKKLFGFIMKHHD